MKVIKVTCCGDCPKAYRTGFNTVTGKASFGCPEIYGSISYGINYNRDLYNHAVMEDEIQLNCPLDDVS